MSWSLSLLIKIINVEEWNIVLRLGLTPALLIARRSPEWARCH
jgi:hypothetical protein